MPSPKATRNLAYSTHLILLLSLSLLGMPVQASTSTITISPLFTFTCNSSGENCPNGDLPSSLIQSANGNFYGTTTYGGTGNQAAGTVFSVTRAGQLTTLYSFVANSHGQFPNGANPDGLLEGNDGFLYGTTSNGGANNTGVVFRLSKTGALQVLYSPGVGGAYGLVLGADGNLYGCGGAGNDSQDATLFRITSEGSYTLLHTFNSTTEGPGCIGMTLASDGNLYGTTLGAETILTTFFRLTSAGQFMVLQTIRYGQFFTSAPVQASNDKFYGGLSRFEDQAEPGIFDSNFSGSTFEDVLLPSFAFGDFVTYMTPASDSNLWSLIAGSSLSPEVISLSPNGNLLHTVTFDGMNGSDPAALIQASDGLLVGVSIQGGSAGQAETANGVIFALDAGLAAPKPLFVSSSQSSGKVGSQVMIHGAHLVGTTAVTFNGVSASFTVLNTGNILATVPSGATTGPIAVTNAGGTTESKNGFTVE